MVQLYHILIVLSVALPLVASRACVDMHADCASRNCRNRRVRRECPVSCRRCVVNSLAQWNNWGLWSSCDVTCGFGERKRERTCIKPPPPPLLADCGGDAEEIEQCSHPSCITGLISDWSTWACDVACGSGTEYRNRACQGTGCTESIQETRSCSGPMCDPAARWADWSEWKCNVVCGTGLQIRTRTCLDSGCEGAAREAESCTLPACPLTDWSACSKSCGTGTQRRYFCTTERCVFQFQACNTQLCPLDSTCSDLSQFRYGSTRECCSDTQVPSGTFCGSSARTKRVIGGTASVAEKWPWLVGFEYRINLVRGFCGGAIISPTYILTAAHCLRDESSSTFFTVTTIYPGILKLQDIGRVNTLPVGIKRVIIHPDFNVKNADIALIEIDRSLRYTPTVRPICLPHGDVTPFEEACYIAGWGVSTLPNLNTNELQEAKVYNFEPLVCTDKYKEINSVDNHVSFLEEYDGFLCAGRLDQRIDACSGDSGAPLVCQRCESCSWYVAGIVSFGPNPCAQPQAPGIYTKVTHFEDWIFDTTGIPRSTVPTC